MQIKKERMIPFVIVNQWQGEGYEPHFIVEEQGGVISRLEMEAVPASARYLTFGQLDEAPIVQDHHPLRPSAYGVFISYSGKDGADLARQQDAAIRLHIRIRHEISCRYGTWFPLNERHVILLHELFPERPFYEDLARADDRTAIPAVIAALETLQKRGLLN